MIRRSFNAQFRQPILEGIKTTTIRDNPWPVGAPIMGFHWSDKPYRSPQSIIAPIIVESVNQIDIGQSRFGEMFYIEHPAKLHWDLWKIEGFENQEAMNRWFIKLVKRDQHVTKWIMRFKLYIP